MTRAIAIETSGRTGSIAVLNGPMILSEVTFPHGLQHAAQLIPLLDRETRAAGWSPREVEHVYVSIGPGSFTGLRIAITLAKTMALATGARIVAVPTTRVLVENAPPEAQRVLIVLDAKRGQIFTSAFDRSADGDWIETEPAHLDTLTAMLARSPRPAHLLGEGIAYHRAAIDPADMGVVVAPEDCWRARASAVAHIGARMALRGEFADPLRLAPTYIRLAEAEEKWVAGVEAQKQKPAGSNPAG